MGGDIYSFSLSAGVSLDTFGSISLTSDQVNSNRYTKGKEQVWIGDVLWCCFQAVTTIGYGDITVTSAVGRAIVVALSVVGILFVAVLTAAVVSYCNELMLARPGPVPGQAGAPGPTDAGGAGRALAQGAQAAWLAGVVREGALPLVSQLTP